MNSATQNLPLAAQAHERRLGRPLRDVILTDWADWTVEEIAAELGVSAPTAHRWLARLGLGKRYVFVERHDDHGKRSGVGVGHSREAAA